MGTFHYTGVTAYVRNNEALQSRLRVIAEALWQFEHLVDMDVPVAPKHHLIAASSAFRYLEDNAGFFSQHIVSSDAAFPVNTPAEYLDIQIEEVNVKGIPMLRMYFPVVQKNDARVEEMANGTLRPLLISLFGEDLVSLKTRSAEENQDFADAKETVVVAPQPQRVPVR